MIFVFAWLIAVVLAEDPLRSSLRSPKGRLNLFSQFKKRQHLRYHSVGEDRKRLELFLESARQVADFNEDKEDKGFYEVNFFSVLTDEEQKMYLGINSSLSNPDLARSINPFPSKLTTSLPSRKLWTNTGHVTKIKDQKSCGSCWTFAAVGTLETAYKIKTGVLRNFAEQEYLDCTQEKIKDKDGCKGNYPHNAFAWSIRNGGRLAASKNRPYENRDRECRAHITKNAMIAAKITGYRGIGQTEQAHIQELQNNAISVILFVSKKFKQYAGGLMRDTTCTTDDNAHAVVLVGYTQMFLLIKNSWGTSWGVEGFAKLARGHDHCELFKYGLVPILTLTGVSDSGSDAATPYRPFERFGPSCKDRWDKEKCERVTSCCKGCYSMKIRLPFPNPNFVRTYCPETCGFCVGDKEKCPKGKRRCKDHVCRSNRECYN